MNGVASIYNKKIKEKVLDNCLIDKKTDLVGMYKGFYVSINMLVSEPQITVVINANKEEDVDNVWLKTYLNNSRSNMKDVISVDVNANMIMIKITRPFLGKKVPEVINCNVNYIISCLENNGYSTCCGKCGVKGNISCYEINGNYRHFCDNCVLEINEKMAINRDVRMNSESNLLKGIVGAVIGSLVGVLAWIIIYNLGFIAGIAGYIIAMGALKGYEKLGGNLNKKGVIASVVVMILMVWFANRLACTWLVYDVLGKEYTFFSCFTNLSDILELGELTGVYYQDLIIGYVISFLGSYKVIASAFSFSTGKYSIKKG